MSRVMCVVASLVLAAGSAGALTLNVTTTADGIDPTPGDGLCGSPQPCTLRAAIQEANASVGADSIWLPAGTFTLTRAGANEDAAATGDLDILYDVDIVGAGPEATIVNAAGLDRVFHVPGSSQVLFHGLTITGGSAQSATSFIGGGILAPDHADLSIAFCTFTANHANAGGALFLHSGSAVEVRSSSFTGNQAHDLGFTNANGAAVIGLEGTTVTIRSSTFSGNTGPASTTYTIDVENSSSFSLLGSTVSANPAGGVRVYQTVGRVYDSTIVGSPNTGLSVGSFDGTPTLTLRNSIVADNLGDCYIVNVVYNHTSNLASDTTCNLDAGAGELPSTDPLLGPLADNGGPTWTHLPLPGSPAIDATVAGVSFDSVDQRGASRPQDGDGDSVAVCDIGSTEAADLIFADGFETYLTWYWSVTQP